MKICLLTAQDRDAYCAHLERHLPEPGVAGIISQPFPHFEPVSVEDVRKAVVARWQREVGATPWERAWGVFDGARIVGHLELRGNAFAPLAHRAKLAMGVEGPFRGRGWGSALLKTALQWVAQERSLDWIDLYVFAYNEAALALYQSQGFECVGRVKDCLRVSGISIEDWHFVLDLRAHRARNHLDRHELNHRES